MSKNIATSGFVYIWRDKKSNRYYVGSHWGTANDSYICSSRWMRKSYSRRPEDFKRRIIAWVDTNRVDLLIEEQRWLQMIKPHEIKARYFNIRLDTQHLWHSHDGEAKLSIGQKISASKRDKKSGPCSPERAKATSEGKKKAFDKRFEEFGYRFDPEHREKISSTKRLRKHKHTNEWKAANSEKLKQQWADGTRAGKPRDPLKLKPRKIVQCKICGVDTLNSKKNFCSKEHRYQVMNATRAALPDSKWFSYTK